MGHSLKTISYLNTFTIAGQALKNGNRLEIWVSWKNLSNLIKWVTRRKNVSHFVKRVTFLEKWFTFIEKWVTHLDNTITLKK